MSDLPEQAIIKPEIKEPINKLVINTNPFLTRYEKLYKLIDHLKNYGITFDELMVNSFRKIQYYKIQENEVDIKIYTDVPDPKLYPAEYLYALLYPFLECQNIMFRFSGEKPILVQFDKETLIYNSINVDSLLKYMEKKRDRIEYNNKLDYVLVPIQLVSSLILGFFLGRAIARSL
jgi:hypothetical protein